MLFCNTFQVELIVCPSDEVIPRLRADFDLEKLDFVFMDHWKKCYLPDLQVRLLKGGCLCCGQNVYTILPILFLVVYNWMGKEKNKRKKHPDRRLFE